jgi:hypothetical protein
MLLAAVFGWERDSTSEAGKLELWFCFEKMYVEDAISTAIFSRPKTVVLY